MNLTQPLILCILYRTSCSISDLTQRMKGESFGAELPSTPVEDDLANLMSKNYVTQNPGGRYCITTTGWDVIENWVYSLLVLIGPSLSVQSLSVNPGTEDEDGIYDFLQQHMGFGLSWLDSESMLLTYSPV